MRKQLKYAILLSLTLSVAAEALTLDEAIKLGKERSLINESSRIARERVEGQITEAWSNALPQVDGTVAYQRSWKAPVMFFPNDSGGTMKIKTQQNNSSMAEATLTQPLYTFGRVAAGLKAAYAARSANEHLTSYTDKSLELEIMRRYWSVLLLRDILEVRKAGLAVSDSALQRVIRLRDVGLMSDYDVLRAQVQVSNQVPPLRQAESNLQLAELSLCEGLGVPLDTTLTVEGSLADFTGEMQTESAPAGMQPREDLEALRDVNSAYQQAYTIYKNMHWPTLGGQVKYSWQWSNDQWDIRPDNNASAVSGGLALMIPLWSSGRNSGKAQQIKADWRKAQLDLANAERGARLQLESARSVHTAALASVDAARTTVKQAEEARRLAHIKLGQGQLTLLEVEAAQLDETAAKVALAAAEYDLLLSAASLRLAAGLSPYTQF